MLTINGLRNFYYVPDVTDMRCGYHRLMQIVKHKFHRDPYSGDVFLFMSKDRRKVKMIHFEKHAYYLHEKIYANGYKFMKISYAEDDLEHKHPIFQISWKQVVAFLEMPVVESMKITASNNAGNISESSDNQ